MRSRDYSDRGSTRYLERSERNKQKRSTMSVYSITVSSIDVICLQTIEAQCSRKRKRVKVHREQIEFVFWGLSVIRYVGGSREESFLPNQDPHYSDRNERMGDHTIVVSK